LISFSDLGEVLFDFFFLTFLFSPLSVVFFCPWSFSLLGPLRVSWYPASHFPFLNPIIVCWLRPAFFLQIPYQCGIFHMSFSLLFRRPGSSPFPSRLRGQRFPRPNFFPPPVLLLLGFIRVPVLSPFFRLIQALVSPTSVDVPFANCFFFVGFPPVGPGPWGLFSSPFLVPKFCHLGPCFLALRSQIAPLNLPPFYIFGPSSKA